MANEAAAEPPPEPAASDVKEQAVVVPESSQEVVEPVPETPVETEIVNNAVEEVADEVVETAPAIPDAEFIDGSEMAEVATATTSTNDNSVSSNSGGGSGGSGKVDADPAATSTDDISVTTPTGSTGTSSDESTADSNNSAATTPAKDTVSTTNTTEAIVPAEPVPETVVEGRYVVTDENYYQFSKQSCVAVGDGTYHCSLATEAPVDTKSVVYAERDEDGDMEIYLKTKRGNIEKITDNAFDDSSPSLDVESMQLVWQRMIDGRYQIIKYDLYEREERQLTFSRSNNMEPKVSAAGIVWQAWDGHDWEIMYFDGMYTDQLTDNETQDVTPVIQDRYVLWSILGGNEQEAQVYSLDSKETMTIVDHEGGSIVNPRFVLVYDTRFENGDVITQGFDPTTGISEPIAATPAEDPVEIPDTDPIGEIRALIQNKSSQKDKEVIHDASPDTGNNDLNLAGTSSPDTINVKQIQAVQLLDNPDFAATTTSDVNVPDFELTEFDLVIAPAPSSSRTIGNVIVSTTSSSTQR